MKLLKVLVHANQLESSLICSGAMIVWLNWSACERHEGFKSDVTVVALIPIAVAIAASYVGQSRPQNLSMFEDCSRTDFRGLESWPASCVN